MCPIALMLLSPLSDLFMLHFHNVYVSSGNALIPNSVLELQDEQLSPSSPRIPILALHRSFLLHIVVNPSLLQ